MSTLASAGSEVRYRTAIRYTDRRSKALYIADKYAALLTGSVLDVGCDEAPLRKLVHQPVKYMGIDIRPGSDLVLDLDQQNLPLEDRSFDTVLCTDVLEHLERCHAVFDELCRVADKWVIVSLPNPLRNLLMALTEGTSGGGRLKYYGLPVNRPADRHRWFFGAEEAAEFLRERGRRNGFEVVQLDFEDGGCPSWRNREGLDMLDSPNVKLGTLWCVLARQGK
jgi:SAM-dependent methyltransferase